MLCCSCGRSAAVDVRCVVAVVEARRWTCGSDVVEVLLQWKFCVVLYCGESVIVMQLLLLDLTESFYNAP